MLAYQELINRCSPLPTDQFCSSLKRDILENDIILEILPDFIDFVCHIYLPNILDGYNIKLKYAFVKKKIKIFMRKEKQGKICIRQWRKPSLII